MATGDNFGNDVSQWGDLLAVGADGVSVNSNNNSGAVYIFKYKNGSWVQNKKIVSPEGTADHTFGHGVSMYQDYLAVGATGDNGNTGAVYVYRRQSSGNWSQVHKLTASDGASGDRFGGSVAIYGTRMVVGAYHDDDKGLHSGCVYLFERQHDNTWTQISKLYGDDTTTNDLFGRGVATYESRIVVGAPGDDDGGGETGSVYVFDQQSNGSWSQTSKLTAADRQQSDYFGDRVGLYGDQLAVGAYGVGNGTIGKVYIFQYQNSSWSQTETLESSDTASNSFGKGVSLHDRQLVVGAVNDGYGPGVSQHVYVYTTVTTPWTLTNQVVADDVYHKYAFGRDVVIQDDLMVVGRTASNAVVDHYIYFFKRQSDGTWDQWLKTRAGNYQRTAIGRSMHLNGNWLFVGAYVGDSWNGRAYVFNLSAMEAANTVSYQQLTVPNNQKHHHDHYGRFVCSEGNWAVISAPARTASGYDYDTGDNDVGAAHVFQLSSNDVWAYTKTLTASDGDRFHSFGSNVDIDNDRIAVAARGDNLGGAWGGSNGTTFERTWRGSVYIYDYADGDWTETAKISGGGEMQNGVDTYQFGSVLALSGDMLIAGDVLNNVYVYEYQSSNWTLTNSITSASRPNLATGATLTGNINLWPKNFVGGVELDKTNNRMFIAYRDPQEVAIYDRQDDGNWTETVTLCSANPETGGNYGIALDIDETNNRLAVGARLESSSRPGQTTVYEEGGRVYVYEYGDVYVEPTQNNLAACEITTDAWIVDGTDPSDSGSGTIVLPYDIRAFSSQFGRYVEADGVWMATQHYSTWGPEWINEPGNVHMFKYDGNGWVRKQTLSAVNSDSTQYGYKLSLNGDRMAVLEQTVSGALLQMYTQSNDVWTHVSSTSARNGSWYGPGSIGNRLIHDWALNDAGDHIAIGNAAFNSNNDPKGRTFIYQLTGADTLSEMHHMVEVQELRETETSTGYGPRYGASVDWQGDTLMVGSGYSSNPPKVFMYELSSSAMNSFVRTATLDCGDAGDTNTSDDWNQVAVTLNGSSAAIGLYKKEQVQIWEKCDNAWTYRYTIDKPHAPVNEAIDDPVSFGSSVALLDDQLIIGAHTYATSGSTPPEPTKSAQYDTGAVFTHSMGTSGVGFDRAWLEKRKTSWGNSLWINVSGVKLSGQSTSDKKFWSWYGRHNYVYDEANIDHPNALLVDGNWVAVDIGLYYDTPSPSSLVQSDANDVVSWQIWPPLLDTQWLPYTFFTATTGSDGSTYGDQGQSSGMSFISHATEIIIYKNENKTTETRLLTTWAPEFLNMIPDMVNQWDGHHNIVLEVSGHENFAIPWSSIYPSFTATQSMAIPGAQDAIPDATSDSYIYNTSNAIVYDIGVLPNTSFTFKTNDDLTGSTYDHFKNNTLYTTVLELSGDGADLWVDNYAAVLTTLSAGIASTYNQTNNLTITNGSSELKKYRIIYEHSDIVRSAVAKNGDDVLRIIPASPAIDPNMDPTGSPDDYYRSNVGVEKIGADYSFLGSAECMFQYAGMSSFPPDPPRNGVYGMNINYRLPTDITTTSRMFEGAFRSSRVTGTDAGAAASSLFYFHWNDAYKESTAHEEDYGGRRSWTDASYMYKDCDALESFYSDLKYWQVSSVSNFEGMFVGTSITDDDVNFEEWYVTVDEPDTFAPLNVRFTPWFQQKIDSWAIEDDTMLMNLYNTGFHSAENRKLVTVPVHANDDNVLWLKLEKYTDGFNSSTTNVFLTSVSLSTGGDIWWQAMGEMADNGVDYTQNPLPSNETIPLYRCKLWFDKPYVGLENTRGPWPNVGVASLSARFESLRYAYQMFKGYRGMVWPNNEKSEGIDLTHWDISKNDWLQVEYMFEDATMPMTTLSDWNLSGVTSTQGMFKDGMRRYLRVGSNNKFHEDGSLVYSPRPTYQSPLTSMSYDFNSWDVSNVTDMDYMFHDALPPYPTKPGYTQGGQSGHADFNITFADWNTLSATTMYSMFNERLTYNTNDGNYGPLEDDMIDFDYWPVSANQPVSADDFCPGNIYFHPWHQITQITDDDTEGNKWDVPAEETVYEEVIRGTGEAKIHRLNVFNPSITTITAYIKVREGRSGVTVTMRKVILEPFKGLKYAAGLGDDDVLFLVAKHDGSETITLDVTWW